MNFSNPLYLELLNVLDVKYLKPTARLSKNNARCSCLMKAVNSETIMQRVFHARPQKSVFLKCMSDLLK